MDLFSSPPPLAPPTTEGNRLAWLRLLRSHRVGVATFLKLMAEHHNDAEAALNALPKIALAAGVKDYSPCSVDHALKELHLGRQVGAFPVFRGEPAYPAALAQVSDAPIMLWVAGNVSLLAEPGIALVGTRNASSIGLRMAGLLSRDLGAAGMAIVSGLARGIDTAAHEAALETGTIAVVAGGIDIAYPSENAGLMQKIAETGAVVSEMPPTLKPQARHFPRRNRIISGLARAVVVVEAAPKSGSLITAREAADQGREVMAVPGHPIDGRAAGCNLLLRDGATLIRDAKDVLQALDMPPPAPAVSTAPPKSTAAKQPSPSPSQPLDSHILAMLSAAPVPEDQLLRELRCKPGDFGEALLSLELDGKVARHPGGLIARSA